MELSRSTRPVRHTSALRSAAVMLVLLALAAMAGADPVAPFVPPLPEVEGPIPVSDTSFPFLGAGVAGDAGLPPG